MPTDKNCQPQETWRERFEKKHYGRMFECGDFEELLNDFQQELDRQAVDIGEEKIQVNGGYNTSQAFNDGWDACRKAIENSIAKR